LKRSNRLILLIGVFLAVVAFVLIVILLGGSGPGGPGPSPTPAPKSTVIAAKDIALGATITEDMLTTQNLPPSQRLTGAFEVPSQVIGQVARQAVATGGQVTSATINASGPQPIVVPPGQRAMSVQVDAVSGVGTAIQTGDYVDMIVGLTGDAFPVVQLNPQDNSIQVVAGLNNTSVKLIIEGVQVLGTVQPQPTTNNNQSTPQPSGSPTPSNPELSQDTQELVVLSVTAQQAEVIKFAQMQGNISLVLRSPKDFFDANGQPVLPVPAGTTGVILKTLVDGGYGVLRPELVEAILPAQ
jgi:Flp pilus assembly protein CpaB